MKNLFDKLKQHFGSSFHTQLSQWYMERNREKSDRTIQVITEGRLPSREKSGKGWMGNHTLHSFVKANKMPIHLLPNVKTFKIALRTFDIIFKLFGMDRKHKPEIRIYTLSKNIEQMNRYVVYQFHRMSKYKAPAKVGGMDRSWVVGTTLIKRSVAFRLMALRHVLPNWYRAEKLTYILRILQQTQRLALKDKRSIDFKRSYIPKPNGKLRPLGVPKVWWRIYLHQWQCITVWNVRHILSPHQHGFRPQMGVLTAWTDVMNKVINKKYIYEFDIKSFFDNVEWVAMLQVMVTAEPRVPREIREFFQDLIDSRPKIKEAKLPERSLDIDAAMALEDTMTAEVVETWSTAQSIEGRINGQHFVVTGKPTGKPTAMTWTGPSPTYPQTGLTHQQLRWQLQKGVPQGAPLSPILAILALETDMKNITVQYADDGLKAEDEPFDFKLNDFSTYYGIELAPEKCGWVRYNGEWLKPLKFLGMEYDGSTDTFRASTRNGATLEFKGGPSAIPGLLRELERLSDHDYISGKGSAEGTRLRRESLPIDKQLKYSWRTMFRSEYFGLFFSRMQCDAWNMNVAQDFTLNKGLVKDSWLYKLQIEELGPVLYDEKIDQYEISSSGELNRIKESYQGERSAPSTWGSLRDWLNLPIKWVKVKLLKWGVVRLDTFNASSFALYDLSQRIRRGEERKREAKMKRPKVSVKSNAEPETPFEEI